MLPPTKMNAQPAANVNSKPVDQTPVGYRPSPNLAGAIALLTILESSFRKQTQIFSKVSRQNTELTTAKSFL
jgi:hypothetical protein